MSFNQIRRLKRKPPELVSIAPLIDVVFLLLIFFLYNSQGSEIYSGLSIKNLPQSKIVDKVIKRDIVLVIGKNRNIKLGNKIIKANEIEKELNNYLNKTKTLIVASDKDIPIGYVISIVGRAKKIGFKEVQIASVQER